MRNPRWPQFGRDRTIRARFAPSAYESEWIGSKNDANPPAKVGGDGEPVLGFLLRANPKEVTAMGLLTQGKKTSPRK